MKTHADDAQAASSVRQTIQKLLSTGFVHIFSSNVLNRVVSMLSGLLIINLLTVDDYGTYSYANNVLNTFLLFNGLGASSAIIQLGSENLNRRHKQRMIVHYGLRIGIVFDLVLAFIQVLFVSFYEVPIKGADLLIVMMAGLPLLYFLVEVLTVKLRIELKNKEFSYLNSAIAIVSALFILIGGFLRNIQLIVVLRYAAYIVVLIFFVWRMRSSAERRVSGTLGTESVAADGSSDPALPEVEHSAKLSKKERKTFLYIAIISMVTNSVSSLLYIIDGWLIGEIMGSAEAVASFTTASLIPFALGFIPGSIMTYVYPHVASNKDDRTWLVRNLRKLYGALAITNAVITVLLIVLAPLIYQLIFPKYTDSIPIFRVLSIGYFFLGTFRIPSGNILVMLRKLHVNTQIAIASGVLNIILDYWLITRFGTMGAAFSTVSIFVVTGLVSTSYLMNHVRRMGTEMPQEEETE